MCIRQLAIFLTAAFFVSTCPPPAQAQNRVPNQPSRFQGEPAPTFHVNEVLPPSVIRGPDYVIATEVPVRDYKYLFTLHTPYGEMQALGRSMLEQRLNEFHAISYARKLVDKPQLVQGLLETLKQTPQGVKVVVTEPIGTLARTPRGLKRMASNLLDPQNNRAGGEERRRFAAHIGCDPETSNPVLVALLDNLAIRKSIGKTGSNVGMHVILPGLGLLPTTKDFKSQLIRKSPAEINNETASELRGMGVWEPVARQFCLVRNYTTLQRMVFMDHLRAVRDVENVQHLVHRATTAYNEAEGLGIIREMRMIRRLHENRGVARVELLGLPIAVLRDGQVVIITASDYIHDTQELRDALAAFRRARPNDPTTLFTAGHVSASTRETLSKFGMKLFEDGQIEFPERISR